jgi:3-dehydroquinate synthase
VSVRFRVELAPGAPRGHEVVVGRGLERELTELLRELAPSGLFVVSDRNVAGLHLPALEAALREGGFAAAPACVLEPGEGSKSPAALVRLWEALLAAGLDRGGVVLALGGGVVGDVAGFAAATWLRGVRVVHLPTTLLAMIDSALGGKTALDLGGAKNQVGAFHPPAGLVADLERLCTLPARERAAGLGEAWKTALLAGEPLLSRAEASAAGARAGDLDALAPLVEGCLRHKAAVVAADERDERGLRALLNLGHTVGHALEAARPALLHGEAVAIGVHVALRLSERLGRAEPGFVPRALTLGHALGLTLAPDRPLELDELRPWLARDKKRGAAGLQWVLPRGPGRAELATADEASVQGALLDVLLRSGAARPR